ncbi:type IV pilus twitching motility protein PilT [Candidatus Margulisiibacteriota bacterium]
MKDLLKRMIEAKASDLILEANAPAVLRVNGELQFEKKVFTAQELAGQLLVVLTADQKARLEKDRQLDFSHALPSGERFRMNFHYQKGSLAAAVRAIPKTVPNRRELNLPIVIEELTKLNDGLILVTGPTGSGKTTTQACMVELINQTRAEHIITIEDPIEYVIENKKSIIEQREVGSDALNFASALRAALREDPDVILIGEMRDIETISTAMTAAETGHLIISTLHTANAINAIDRVIDVFPENQQNQIRSQLSMVLQAVLAQQLIPRIDQKGQVVAMEILKGIPGIRNLIRKGATHEIPSLIEVSKKHGMQTMENALLDLHKGGKINLEEALIRVPDRETFKKRLA